MGLARRLRGVNWPSVGDAGACLRVSKHVGCGARPDASEGVAGGDRSFGEPGDGPEGGLVDMVQT